MLKRLSTFKRRYHAKSFWRDHFHPHRYLETFYPTDSIREDELAVMRYQNIFLRDKKFDTCLDVGSGPTVHHAIALAPYVEQLYVTDYLEDNMYEVQKWVNGAPHRYDWSHYTRKILHIETGVRPMHVDVASRHRMTRHKTQLGTIDLMSDQPLGDQKHLPRRYDLVTSFFCPDSITESQSEYRRMIQRLVDLVVPGGSILLAALAETDHYMVGDKRLPSAKVDYTLMKDSLIAAGISLDTVSIAHIAVPAMKSEGFDHILMGSGTKPQ